MTYPLRTSQSPRQRRENRRLRQARWQMRQMAREIDALRKRLEEKR